MIVHADDNNTDDDDDDDDICDDAYTADDEDFVILIIHNDGYDYYDLFMNNILGLKIHGLLVGRNESYPLNLLCNGNGDVNNGNNENRVYNFLCKYDYFNMMKSNDNRDTNDDDGDDSSVMSINQKLKSVGRGVVSSSSSSSRSSSSSSKKIGRNVRSTSKTRVFSRSSRLFSKKDVNNNNDIDSYNNDSKNDNYDSILLTNYILKYIEDVNNIIASLPIDYNNRTDDDNKDDYHNKDIDRNNKKSSKYSRSSSSSSSSIQSSYKKQRNILQYCLRILNKGLIERECEVKLLLLATLAQEHIVFIGPPGTGKSELSRRLAWLQGGFFFERLLTR